MSSIIISIIIPTRNRSWLLRKTLYKLLPLLSKKEEVLIIDNLSSDNTKDLVQGLIKNSDKKIFFYRSTKIGPSYSRNIGIKRSKGQYLVFLDDDCLVNKNWLINIRKTISKEKRSGKTEVHQGRIDHKYIKDKNIYSEIFLIKNRIEKEIYISTKHSTIDFLNAGNFFVKRSVLKTLTLPGFNEKDFPFIGEEKDLAIRLQLAGFKIKYEPVIWVTHLKTGKGLYGHLTTSYKYGNAFGKLDKKYRSKKSIRKLFPNSKIEASVESKKIKEQLKKKMKSKYSGLRYLKVTFFIFIKNFFYQIGFKLGKYY